MKFRQIRKKKKKIEVCLFINVISIYLNNTFLIIHTHPYI